MESRLVDLLPRRTASEEETRALGRALAERLRAGDVVGLYGELGAGKTMLVKGLCEGMGIDPAQVNSPTFTLMNQYGDGRLPVYHFDAYRLEHIEEFFDLGYEEYFYSEGVSVVEWADKVEPLLPADVVRLRLQHADGCRIVDHLEK